MAKVKLGKTYKKSFVLDRCFEILSEPDKRMWVKNFRNNMIKDILEDVPIECDEIKINLGMSIVDAGESKYKRLDVTLTAIGGPDDTNKG